MVPYPKICVDSHAKFDLRGKVILHSIRITSEALPWKRSSDKKQILETSTNIIYCHVVSVVSKARFAIKIVSHCDFHCSNIRRLWQSCCCCEKYHINRNSIKYLSICLLWRSDISSKWMTPATTTVKLPSHGSGHHQYWHYDRHLLRWKSNCCQRNWHIGGRNNSVH